MLLAATIRCTATPVADKDAEILDFVMFITEPGFLLLASIIFLAAFVTIGGLAMARPQSRVGEVLNVLCTWLAVAAIAVMMTYAMFALYIWGTRLSA